VARRRTCFSCGQAQSGSAPFCSSCGKPVDAPDLELLSGDTSATIGTDITMARGGSRIRSVLVIGAVVAAIGSAAAFTGNTAKSSSASTTTEPTTSTTERTTTTEATASTTEATITTVAPLVPRKLDALPLPGETTGATLLLLGGSVGDGSLGRSRILDVDRGVLTTLDDTRSFNGDQIIFAPTSKGLVAAPMYGSGTASIELWQRDGSVRPVVAADSGGPLFRGQSVFAGDTLWSTEFNPTGAGGQSLTSFSFRNGERVVWLKDATDISLVGVDTKGRPVVNGLDGGAYTFDPLTRTFARLTAAPVEAVSEAGRVEVECTTSLICTEVFRGVDGTLHRLNFPTGGRGNISFSPDGKHAVKVSYGFGGSEVTCDVADTSTGEVVHLGGFDQSQGQVSFPVWTSDGRWLFLQLATGLAAWREGLSAPVIMQVDGKPIESFAVGVFPN
jgi:hypothetical protein